MVVREELQKGRSYRGEELQRGGATEGDDEQKEKARGMRTKNILCVCVGKKKTPSKEKSFHSVLTNTTPLCR